MATRQAKYGGLTTYAAELAAGFPLIKASEVDSDLEQLYTNITNVNVAAGAAIAYSKLNLTNQLLTADLTDNIITTPKILDTAVTLAKLAPLSVSTAKIVGGATIAQFNIFSDPAVFGLTDNVLTLVNEVVLATPRTTTSTVFIVGNMNGYFLSTGITAGTATIQIQLRHSGTAGVADGTILYDVVMPVNNLDTDSTLAATRGWASGTEANISHTMFSAVTGNTVVRYKLILKAVKGTSTTQFLRSGVGLFIVEMA